MAFNSIGQMTATHKTWDHVGNILPNLEHSEGVRPAIEWKVAEWLPVQFFDKHYENWMVILGGKVVAVDNDNRLVPAGLKHPVELVGSGDVVTYTADDVAAGTINVATGSAVTTAELTDGGGTSRGYTAAEIASAGFLGRSGVSLTISSPVGVAPYAYLQWAGGDGFNPAEYKQHNYNMQHQVAVLCDYVLELPLVPGAATSEALVFAVDHEEAGVFTDSGLSNLPVAANTIRTPMTFAGGSSATLFVNQVATKADIASAGDWAIDLETGHVSVKASVAPTAVTLSYHHYAAVPATVSAFACAVGDLKGGDMVTFDANSNFCKATSTNLKLDASPTGAQVARSLGLVVGQVLDRDSSHPRSALDKVKTSFSPALGTSSTGSKPAYLGQLDQMPGSANGGVPSNVHYTGAADTVVRINLTRF